MKLKKKYSNQDDVPAFARGFFTENDSGDWVPIDGIDVDAINEQMGGGEGGTDPRVAQFRDSNRRLTDELQTTKTALAEIRQQFDGVKPEEFAAFREQLEKIEDEKIAKAMKEGRLDDVVQMKVARTLEEKNQELKTRDERFTELKGKYDHLLGIHTERQATQAITRHLSDAKVRIRDERAREDLHNRIGLDWTTDPENDFSLVLKNKSLTGESGQPMTEAEYVQDLVKRRDYLFVPAGGGGSPGNEGGDDDEPTGTIAANDPAAFGRNLAEIANGKKKVAAE